MWLIIDRFFHWCFSLNDANHRTLNQFAQCTWRLKRLFTNSLRPSWIPISISKYLVAFLRLKCPSTELLLNLTLKFFALLSYDNFNICLDMFSKMKSKLSGISKSFGAISTHHLAEYGFQDAHPVVSMYNSLSDIR